MNNKKQKGGSDSGDEYRLVYSTDPVKPSAAKSTEPLPSGSLKPAVRIERKGRNGKTVTVVSKLPAHDTFLKDLCAYLKRSLGSGGSYSCVDGQGLIEIQGDRREQIVTLVETYSQKKA